MRTAILLFILLLGMSHGATNAQSDFSGVYVSVYVGNPETVIVPESYPFTAEGEQAFRDYDPAVDDPKRIRRLLLCSGKIYYDLAAHRTKIGAEDVGIVRIEQLFPFRLASVRPVIERYTKAKEIVWVQEEPKNMGAYRHVEAILREQLDLDLPYVGREASASPAVASMKMHLQEQERIVVNAMGLPAESDEETLRDTVTPPRAASASVAASAAALLCEAPCT